MSTRFLALFTTAAVSVTSPPAAAAATASLAAPPPSDPDPVAAAPPASPSPSATPTASPSPSAKDDKELKECADADCEVTVQDGQTIKLDKKYGLDPIHIKIDDSRVTFTIRGANTKMISQVDASQMSNTSATYNGITFRPRMTKDGKMTLKISHD